MNSIADYKHVWALLQRNPGKRYKTHEIAEAIHAQDNSVQRAINYNLKQYRDLGQLKGKRVNGSQVFEYWYDSDVLINAKPKLRQVQTQCKCGSWYMRGDKCNICGAVRHVPE